MYKVIVSAEVSMFLLENRMRIKDELQEKINVLKENPRLYPVIHNNDIVRSFYISSLAFSYIIDDNNKLITITEAEFIKSSLKLKVK
ncbi:hypothetical protein B5E87_10080 [Massilimicrobiota sp. An142]|uniref:hypothetical protein n=1 Tax=Massilimicrobiota sp. An142 TaxID=1965564 RepID=UPI000B3841F1|nr:hypothetical protein [Massilimicrobiota sp. An142]OUQ12361.1 hypothetical protein B5E87_10080 [Massilimicrobiota sp. An142]